MLVIFAFGIFSFLGFETCSGHQVDNNSILPPESGNVRNYKERKFDFSKYHPIYEARLIDSTLQTNPSCIASNKENNLDLIDFLSVSQNDTIIDIAVSSTSVFVLLKSKKIKIFSVNNEILKEEGELMQLEEYFHDEQDIFLLYLKGKLLLFSNTKLLKLDLGSKAVTLEQYFIPRKRIYSIKEADEYLAVAAGVDGVDLYKFWDDALVLVQNFGANELQEKQSRIDIRDTELTEDRNIIVIDKIIGLFAIDYKTKSYQKLSASGGEKIIYTSLPSKSSILVAAKVSENSFSLMEILWEAGKNLRINREIVLNGTLKSMLALCHFALLITSNGFKAPLLGIDAKLKNSFFVTSAEQFAAENDSQLRDIQKGIYYRNSKLFNHTVVAIDPTRILLFKIRTAFTEIICKEDQGNSFKKTKYFLDLKTPYCGPLDSLKSQSVGCNFKIELDWLKPGDFREESEASRIRMLLADPPAGNQSSNFFTEGSNKEGVNNFNKQEISLGNTSAISPNEKGNKTTGSRKTESRRNNNSSLYDILIKVAIALSCSCIFITLLIIIRGLCARRRQKYFINSKTGHIPLEASMNDTVTVISTENSVVVGTNFKAV